MDSARLVTVLILGIVVIGIVASVVAMLEETVPNDPMMGIALVLVSCVLAGSVLLGSRARERATTTYW